MKKLAVAAFVGCLSGCVTPPPSTPPAAPRPLMTEAVYQTTLNRIVTAKTYQDGTFPCAFGGTMTVHRTVATLGAWTAGDKMVVENVLCRSSDSNNGWVEVSGRVVYTAGKYPDGFVTVSTSRNSQVLGVKYTQDGVLTANNNPLPEEYRPTFNSAPLLVFSKF